MLLTLLQSSGITPSTQKVYQEIWIIEEGKKRKKKVKNKLKNALKAVEVAEKAQLDGIELQQRLKAIEAANQQVTLAIAALELEERDLVLKEAVLNWEVERNQWEDAQNRYQKLVRAYEEAKVEAEKRELNDLMQLMAYMLQLD
jgi:hypothetical protein